MEKKKGCIKKKIKCSVHFCDTTDIYYSYSFPQKIFIESDISAQKKKKNSVLGKPKYTQTLPKGTLKKHIFMINRS
jgi:hypothetical protein